MKNPINRPRKVTLGTHRNPEEQRNQKEVDLEHQQRIYTTMSFFLLISLLIFQGFASFDFNLLIMFPFQPSINRTNNNKRTTIKHQSKDNKKWKEKGRNQTSTKTSRFKATTGTNWSQQGTAWMEEINHKNMKIE